MSDKINTLIIVKAYLNWGFLNFNNEPFPVSECSFTQRFTQGQEGAETPLDKDMVATDLSLTCPYSVDFVYSFNKFDEVIDPANDNDIDLKNATLTLEVTLKVINPVLNAYGNRTVSISTTPQTLKRNQSGTDYMISISGSGDVEYANKDMITDTYKTWYLTEQDILSMDYDNSDISFTVPSALYNVGGVDVLPGDIFEIGDKRIVSSEISCSIRTKSAETTVKGKYTTI